MTRDEALEIVISVAQEWGQNTEEGLPGGRVHADDSDDDLRDVHGNDWEQAIAVRDLWRAINVLQQDAT
jgi:hypothetical protein